MPVDPRSFPTRPPGTRRIVLLYLFKGSCAHATWATSSPERTNRPREEALHTVSVAAVREHYGRDTMSGGEEIDWYEELPDLAPNGVALGYRASPDSPEYRDSPDWYADRGRENAGHPRSSVFQATYRESGKGRRPVEIWVDYVTHRVAIDGEFRGFFTTRRKLALHLCGIELEYPATPRESTWGRSAKVEINGDSYRLAHSAFASKLYTSIRDALPAAHVLDALANVPRSTSNISSAVRKGPYPIGPFEVVEAVAELEARAQIGRDEAGRWRALIDRSGLPSYKKPELAMPSEAQLKELQQERDQARQAQVQAICAAVERLGLPAAVAEKASEPAQGPNARAALSTAGLMTGFGGVDNYPELLDLSKADLACLWLADRWGLADDHPSRDAVRRLFGLADE